MAINNLKAKAIKTALLTMLITTIDTPATIAAGRTANSIANTVLSGSGVPAKSLGINGDFYIDIKTMNMYGPKKSNNWPLPISMRGPAGPKGDTGSTGAQGPKGDTGTAGSLNVNYGTLVFGSLINGVAGSSAASSQFGNFLAGKSYALDVLIYATNSSVPPYSLKLDFSASGGSPTITTKYIVTDGYSYRNSVSVPEYSIYAKVIIDGSSVTTNFGLSATVTCGASTSTNSAKLTVNGDYFAQLVGSIN